MEYGVFIRESRSLKKPKWLLISPACDQTLHLFLAMLSFYGVYVGEIQSRSSDIYPGIEYVLRCEKGIGNYRAAIQHLRSIYGSLIVRSKNKRPVPWFPRKIQDLDLSANWLVPSCSCVNVFHPGFPDQGYRTRRQYFARIAYTHRHGQPIPRVDYTKDEIATWGAIFEQVTKLYPTYACKEYNHCFQLMIDNCGYRKNNIPQLEDVNTFLKECTGFTLRPVAGVLSVRNFLAGLAFRVYQSMQYVRYSPFSNEPDLCHELLGHAPLFADPDFAELVQEIGLASIGAPDEYMGTLASCLKFTVELGLCREEFHGRTIFKAYGGRLLSSSGELIYSLSGRPHLTEFQPEFTMMQKVDSQEYQPVYFVTDNFAEAKNKIHQFSETIPRSFIVGYDHYHSRLIITGKAPGSGSTNRRCRATNK